MEYTINVTREEMEDLIYACIVTKIDELEAYKAGYTANCRAGDYEKIITKLINIRNK